MPLDRQFISFAQNAEDVVLWRALGHVHKGRYVEVGANDPVESSITRAFYARGWTGVEIEPVTEFADAYRRERPNDIVVQAAVADTDEESVTLHVVDGTGLSTLDPDIADRHRRTGWTTREEQVPARRLDDVLAEHLTPEDDVHFMVVDVEGAEASVLASVDLTRWRPWVLVVEATAPNTSRPTHEEWEGRLLDAGYVFCLFDGLSRFYVAQEHAAELQAALSAPSSPLDEYTPHAEYRLQEELASTRALLDAAQQEASAARDEASLTRRAHDELLDELIRWRGSVLDRWTQAAGGGSAAVEGKPGHEVVRLRRELAATQATVSWRVTAPLRAVQSRRLRGWR
ncbi:FkbM family methyltransferase [Modestobacter lacusdianchii]